MKTLKENQIETFLISELKKIGVETRKVKWLGRDGAPDRLILHAGGIWIELKRPGELPRANQLLEHEKMIKAGMRVIVIDSMGMANALIEHIKIGLRK